MKLYKYFGVLVHVLGLLLCITHGNAIAGLLEMPDVRDSTTLKGKSVYENIDIPPVRERDPNPQGGPRVWVLKIKIQGVVERPKYGITKKGIEEYAEKLRSASMKEEELLKFGYSLEDLAKIADLMVDIDAGKDLEQVTEPDVQRLIWLVRELKESRGLTLVDIENIADKLTNYYRERGFFLSKVYVPQQEVRKGVLVLTVLEGKLGKVSVANNERYKSEFITKSFDDLLYQPVNEKDVEQKLYLLNDYPGLDVYGYFKAGDQVGDTWLNLQVRDETRWSAVARYDNHGSELTGEQRLYGEVQLHNPLNVADNVTLGVLKTFDPDKATYGIFRYRLPVVSEKYHLGVNFSRNQFATVVGFLAFTGDTTIAEAVFDYTFIRQKEKNWQASFAFAHKDSDLTDDQGLGLDLSDLVQTYTLATRYDSLNSESRILNQLNAGLTSGEILEGTAVGQDKNFIKLTADYSLLSFLNVPGINASTRFVIKSAIQYSDTVLPPVEQFSLGGANRVRAYDIAQFSADSAVYLGIDWIFNVPGFLDFNATDNIRFSRIVQPFIFIDYGYGELNGFNTGNKETGEISGFGFGLQLNYDNKLSGNLQLAKPLAEKFSQEIIDKPDSDIRIVMDIQYLFD